MENEPQTVRRVNIGSIALLALFLLLLIAAGSGAYFYRQLDELKKDPEKIAREEIRKLVEQVGSIMVLPQGEEPTVAMVTDPDALKNQPFFANAKAGDRVLLYANARKAILFDPQANKIVEVAPIDFGNPS